MRSKADLALEMVQNNRHLGIRFAWIGMDGGYGKEPALLRALDRADEVFMADVHKDKQVYLLTRVRQASAGREQPAIQRGADGVH